jgi:hypothetical protein
LENRMLAPGMGSPFSSVTFPGSLVVVCAKADWLNMLTAKAIRSTMSVDLMSRVFGFVKNE